MKYETDSLDRIMRMPGERFGACAACEDNKYGVSMMLRSGYHGETVIMFVLEADLPGFLERLEDVGTAAGYTLPQILRMRELILVAATEIPKLRTQQPS